MFRRALVSMSLLAAGLVAVPAAQQVAHADGLNGGGEFHPLTPAPTTRPTAAANRAM